MTGIPLSPPRPPPVRLLLCSFRSSSAAIPDQDPGNVPLRVLPHMRHTLSLDRAPQEGGRGPDGHTPAHQPCEYTSTWWVAGGEAGVLDSS
jgi:hypothetical protein